MSIVAVQIPLGVPPGGQFMAMMPNGNPMMVINPGLPPGSIVHVRAPIVAPQPMMMATPGEPPKPSTPPPPAEAIKEEDIPKDAEIITATVPAYKNTTMEEAPNPEDLCPCAALCCIAFSIWPVFPDCFGFYCKGKACACIQVEEICCKFSKTEGSLFKCCNGEFNILNPDGFCKCTTTACCIDMRIAIPNDAEVPCQMACLGLVCVKDAKCVCAMHETKNKVSQSV